MSTAAVNYTVAKNGNRWAVLKDGQPLENHTWHRRKRDASEAIPKIIARAEYEARILAQDKTGIVWSEDELRQMDEYVEVLKKNETRFTMAGRHTVQDIAIQAFHDDARLLEGYRDFHDCWDSINGAEIRRRRAALIEIFRRIGIHLDHKRWKLIVSRYRGSKHDGIDWESNHESVEAAQDQMRSIQKAADKAGELGYNFLIVPGKEV